MELPKNQIIDAITVPEFRDKDKKQVCDAIWTRHPFKIPTPEEFNTWLREYLLDHDVKVWKGPIYTFFYREDPDLYDGYVKLSKETGTPEDEILNKKEFFEIYLNTRHHDTVEAEKRKK